MPTKEFWPILIRHKKRELLALWYSYGLDSTNELCDGLDLSGNGSIRSFARLDELSKYCLQRNYQVMEDTMNYYNMDFIASWLKAPAIRRIVCNDFLDAWNLFVDLQSTVEGTDMHRFDKRFKRDYHMLFWGCNLPSVTPEGRHWEPHWRRIHVRQLRAALEPRYKFFAERLTSS